MNAVRFLLIALVLAFGGTHVATAGDMDTVDQATQTRYHSLIAELRCVVCQNRSIAESDAPLAADLRDVVQRRIQAGQTNAEIKHYLVVRYGDWILYDPPIQTSTVLLWGGPFMLLAIGSLIVVTTMRRRPISAAPATSSTDTGADTDKLARILAEDRAREQERGQ